MNVSNDIRRRIESSYQNFLHDVLHYTLWPICSKRTARSLLATPMQDVDNALDG